MISSNKQSGDRSVFYDPLEVAIKCTYALILINSIAFLCLFKMNAVLGLAPPNNCVRMPNHVFKHGRSYE